MLIDKMIDEQEKKIVKERKQKRKEMQQIKSYLNGMKKTSKRPY